MSERPPKTEHPFAHDAKAATAVVDALYHGEFVTTLKSESFEQLTESLGSIVASEPSLGIGEVAIQFFLTDNPKELSDPDSLPWIALVCILFKEEDSFRIQAKRAIMPSKNQDLLEIEGLEDIACIVLEWDDVREDFDVNRHRPCHE